MKAANSTRTSASPSPGKPPDAFSTERTSGPPNLDTLTIRTCSHPFLPLIAPTPQTLGSGPPTQVRTTNRRQAPPVGKHKPQPPCCLLYTSPSPRDGLLSRMP